jgi:multidrug efflux pump subunit AcrB
MWIVKLALDRPYTFIVAAILILFLGLGAIVTTPTDIFPNIDIPVISVIWTYTGLPTEEVEKRITVYSEFVMAIVNDVKSIESQTLNGVAVLKIYFNPQVRVDAATAQVGAAWNTSALDLTIRGFHRAYHPACSQQQGAQ